MISFQPFSDFAPYFQADERENSYRLTCFNDSKPHDCLFSNQDMVTLATSLSFFLFHFISFLPEVQVSLHRLTEENLFTIFYILQFDFSKVSQCFSFLNRPNLLWFFFSDCFKAQYK